MISLFFKVSVTLTSHTPSACWWDAPVTCQVDGDAPVTCQVDRDARTNRFFFCVQKRLQSFTLRWKLNIIQLLWFHRVKQSQTAAVVMIQMNIFTSVRFNTELGDGLFPWRFHKYITQSWSWSHQAPSPRPRDNDSAASLSSLDEMSTQRDMFVFCNISCDVSFFTVTSCCDFHYNIMKLTRRS